MGVKSMLSRVLFGMLWLVKAAPLGLGLIVLASVCFGYYCGIKAAAVERRYAEEDDSC